MQISQPQRANRCEPIALRSHNAFRQTRGAWRTQQRQDVVCKVNCLTLTLTYVSIFFVQRAQWRQPVYFTERKYILHQNVTVHVYKHGWKQETTYIYHPLKTS